MGWKNHTSKQRADAAKHLSFECSLVKETVGPVETGFASGPKRYERALLGYMDREAAKASGQRCDVQFFCSQASDSMWRMPGHTEAMKAVVSCDKPGGAAHTH